MTNGNAMHHHTFHEFVPRMKEEELILGMLLGYVPTTFEELVDWRLTPSFDSKRIITDTEEIVVKWQFVVNNDHYVVASDNNIYMLGYNYHKREYGKLRSRIDRLINIANIKDEPPDFRPY